MGKLLTDDTGIQILEEMRRQTAISKVAAREKISTMTIDQIAKIVGEGYGSELLDIGDQLMIDWKDGETVYNVPNDVVHFENVDIKTGENVPGMFLQWHFCSPFGVQFCNAQAFYVAEKEELPAGTYNIIIGENWGNNCKKGEHYQFTLTQPVPVDGQIGGLYAMADKKPETWNVKTYKDNVTAEAIETAQLTAGSEGINLGTLSFAGDGKLNDLERAAYGWNRWSKSAIRQYLNSTAPKGKWWKPQSKYDRPPEKLTTMNGFLAGYPEDFLKVIKNVKVRTLINTVCDGSEGSYEDTYDKIFLPSLEQEYITPQSAGIEGDVWEYWKIATERTEPTKWWKTYEEGGHQITYGIDGKTTAQTVRLRSAGRNTSGSTWSVGPSGIVSAYYAAGALRFAPACVI